MIALLEGEKQFLFDSAEYWGLSETFVHHGNFSLLSFESTGIRGYALPLTYHILRDVLGPFTNSSPQMVMVFNAALFALVGAVLAPQFARIAWPDIHWGLFRRLALCSLLIVFWRGYLSYPLSDFPALAAALLALIAVSYVDSPSWMLVAGLASGLAMNYRPAYVLLVPILIALFAWERFRLHEASQGSHFRFAACGALFVVGLAAVALPQSLSQHRSSGSYSPIPGGNKLASVQYNEGLAYQRLDVWVGPSVNTVMAYTDPHTEDILVERSGRPIEGTGDYLRLITEHPVTMAGVFLRHVVNALDQRFPTPYVEHLEGGWNKAPRIAGFLLVFLGLVRFLWPAGRRSLGPARWRYPAALLLITIPALPSAAVTRLMLPVFMLCGLLVLAPGWPNPLRSPQPGPRRYTTLTFIVGAGLLFYALVSTIVTGASENLHLVPLP